MKNKYRGTLIGLSLADALCAPYEGGIFERLLWKTISKTTHGEIRYTDDSQMTIDLATSLIENKGINQDKLAIQFADSYRWSRGYGPSSAKLLKNIKKGHHWSQLNTKYFKEGSYGNGAAMRIAPIALMYHNNHHMILSACKQSAIITHAHPDAITGANIIALAIESMLNNKEAELLKQLIEICSENYQQKLILVDSWLKSKTNSTTNDVSQHLGNGIEAINSTVTALYLALRFLKEDYIKLMNHIQKLKGDTDTIAAMAAAIWGAKNGINAINHSSLDGLESKEKLIKLADELYILNSNLIT